MYGKMIISKIIKSIVLTRRSWLNTKGTATLFECVCFASFFLILTVLFGVLIYDARQFSFLNILFLGFLFLFIYIPNFIALVSLIRRRSNS